MILDTTLAKLLEAWQDGGLPEAEEAQLLRLLDSDADLRHRFAGQIAMMGAVRAAAEPNPRWLALFDVLECAGDAATAEVLSFEDLTMKRIAPTRPRHKRPSVWALAAAFTLLLTGPFWLKPRWSNDPGKSAAVPAAPPISFVAVVVGSSPEEGRAAGTYLQPGVISQAAGWLTLQTLNGVSVTLDAPYRAQLLDHESIRLDRGRARVHVPQGAEGFRLDSPAFDVVDLGTEFAANVNSDGTGTCRVFEGKADVSLLDSIGEVKSTRRLTANESVRVTPSKQDLRAIKEDNGDYPEIKQPPRPTLALPPSYAAEVMGMGPLGYWRFEEIRNHEVADEVANGPRLQAAGAAAIANESGGNHSGELAALNPVAFFHMTSHTREMLVGDFSISMFAQFDWLQNFALFTATRFDNEVEGNSFILQSYASFRRSGLNGTGLHAVLYDPPAWDGGVEVYGNTLLRPLFWHHIAATRKGNQLTLYLDGIPVGRESVRSMSLDYREIFVGRLNGNADQPRSAARGLVGHIDELAVFPRSLTEQEVRLLAVTKQ
ncbi:MAG: LamG-like jellyroll fold domain-containing protein [Verrucomicrobiota bacterium]